MKNEKNLEFFGDRPTEEPTDDILGFDRLADRICEAITKGAPKQGFVIGIQGEWGTGKTTLLGFIEDRLQDTENICVLQYNPWLKPKADHVKSFFDELAKKADYEQQDDEHKELARKLRQYAGTSEIVSDAVAGVQQFVDRLALFLGASTGVAFIGSASPWIWLPLLCLFLLSSIVGLVFHVRKLILGYEPKKPDSDLTMALLKDDLNDHLSKLQERFVILIDDIDRLPPEAICDVYQLVKNNGDLENVTYILAFDKLVVKRVLDEKLGPGYGKFTDKIVQLEFDIPFPDQTKVMNFFSCSIEENVYEQLQDEKSFKKHWDEVRYTNFYHSYLKLMVQTLRDAKRLADGIRLNLPLICSKGEPDVNLVDFVVIEIVRVLYPSVYDNIRKNIDLLAKPGEPLDDLFPSDYKERGLLSVRKESFFDEINHAGDAKSSYALRESLRELFPCAALFATGEEDGSNDGSVDEIEEWKSKQRICHTEVFNRFFQYRIGEGDVPMALIWKAVDAIREGRNAANVLIPYHLTDQLRDALDMMRLLVKQSADRPSLLARYFACVFDASDYLIESDHTAMTLPIRFFVPYLLGNLLAEKNGTRQARIMEKAIDSSTGVFGPVFSVCLFEQKSDEAQTRRPFKLAISAKKLSEFREKVYARGMKWLDDDTCLSHPQFTKIIFCLEQWSTDGQFKHALDSLLRRRSNIRKFLSRFCHREETKKYGDAVGDIRLEYDFKGPERYVDLIEARQLLASSPREKGEPQHITECVTLFEEGLNSYLSEKEKKKKRK
jgi:hypothetical protein